MKSISKVQRDIIDVDLEETGFANSELIKSALMLGELQRLGEDRMNEIIKQVLENAEARKQDRT